LKHIYRQSDPEFIGLLNKVRHNCLDRDSMRQLNTRYVPGFQPPTNEPYITLTTTNAVAQEINALNLQRLPGKSQMFSAQIAGDFPTSFYPTEVELEFKRGAQVMFIKNDPDRRYYNGKIGQIVSLDSETILVACPGDSAKIVVTPTEWQNVKYSLNEETKQIEEQVLGLFVQLPLKLAWAITIHKSQGLTFERAIIDAQSAFASGQVYVALSRCKSFEGIVLRTPLVDTSVKTDSVVQQFTEQANRNAPDEGYLRNARQEYESQLLRELFSFDSTQSEFQRILTLYRQHSGSLSPEAVAQLQAIADQASREFFSVVQKFSPQLDEYLKLDTMPSENSELRGRLVKAAAYFSEKLDRLLTELKTVPTSTDNQAVNGMIAASMRSLQFGLFTKSSCFKTCRNGFSCGEYQKAKVNADLDFSQAFHRTSLQANLEIPKGVPHPELYRELLQWRHQKAHESDVGAQAIFPNATLRSLVEILPVDLTQLMQVPGIGKKRKQSIGPQLCEIVQNYCKQQNIDRNEAPDSPLTQSKLAQSDPSIFRISATKQQSFDLLQSGKSIAEIAAERGVTQSTVEGHLVPFIATGQIDIYTLMTKESVDEISQYLQTHPNEPVAEIKKQLGDKYGYGAIKMTISYLQSAANHPDP
jgi:hypothetical protein